MPSLRKSRRRSWRSIGAVLAVCIAAVLGALVTKQTDHDTSVAAPPPSSTTAGTTPEGASTVPETPSLLDRLVIAAPVTTPAYRRAAFGEDWIDADHDCHNTRAEVLMAETRAPVTFNANGCTVNTGLWIDPWDGFESTHASDFQIDHTVPLAEAWRAGAWAWTDERRAAFAQNLDDAGELNALKSSVNTSKSDKTPDQWKPPLRASWCEYATVWARIKVEWGLTVTRAERDALAAMLDTCPPAAVP